MKAKQLEKLGFKRVQDSDEEVTFMYYELELGYDYNIFRLMTNGVTLDKFNEIGRSKYDFYVEIWGYDSFKFYDYKELNKLVKVLRNNIPNGKSKSE